MGIRYEHPALVANDALDPLRPEILLYDPTAPGLVLVVVRSQ